MTFAEEYTRIAAQRTQCSTGVVPQPPAIATEPTEHAGVPTPTMPQVEPEVIDARIARLEEALMRSEAALRAANASRSAFFSAMSHELRTPLNAIMGFAEMMKNGVFGSLQNPTYAEYVQHIHDSGGELLSKVNDLLVIGSMHAHEFALDESIFPLRELFAEMIAVHSHAAFSRDMQLTLDAPENIEISADRRQLLCVLAHFLSNAINHSDAGKEIRISARIQADEGLILSVRDQGEGIAPAQLALIRDALNQEASYFSVQGGGIGLGLSLAGALAARHGGRIMIDSMRHRGTVVSVILPKQRIVRGLPVKKKSENRREHPGRVLELI